MIRYVDHVGITVRDLERAIAFYAKLGFAVVRRMMTATHEVAFVRNGLAELELFAPTTRAPESDRRLHEDDVEHIAFHVDDIDDAVATLEGRGITFTSAVRRTGSRAGILFTDPDGTLLQLLQG
jgi:catechol 2,3-dioxygenase-like lactoylglutathione lyase family enzyme